MMPAVRHREFYTGVFVLALSIGFLLWASTYTGEAGAVPKLVAWLAIALALIDVVSQFETPFGRWVRRIVTADRIIAWKMEGDEDASLKRVLLSIGWLLAYLCALFFVGFLIATPLYILLYMRLHGGRSIRDGVLASVGITLVLWVTFVWLFKYPLYEGIVFGAV
jgi:hypothetical protein